jgi:hypothetical protein
MGALLPHTLKNCLFECFRNAATGGHAARRMEL